jgi:Tfp pilus assembly protein PilF
VLRKKHQLYGAGVLIASVLALASAGAGEDIVSLYLSGQHEDAVRQILSQSGWPDTKASWSWARVTPDTPPSRLKAVMALKIELTVVRGASHVCAGREIPPPGWPARMPTRFRKDPILERLEDPSRGTVDYRFLRAWYLLGVSYDQGLGDLASALLCLEIAPERVVTAPEAQLALGAIHETAWHRTNEDGVSVRGVSGNLKSAEVAYRRAVQHAPALAEARLRLARVLVLQAHYVEAAETLETLRTHPDPHIAYLTRLFEGDLLDRQGLSDAALGTYREARRLLPDAQSPWLASAAARYLRGERNDAAEEVAKAVQVAAAAAADPWLWYLKGTAIDTARYLSAVRTSVQ